VQVGSGRHAEAAECCSCAGGGTDDCLPNPPLLFWCLSRALSPAFLPALCACADGRAAREQQLALKAGSRRHQWAQAAAGAVAGGSGGGWEEMHAPIRSHVYTDAGPAGRCSTSLCPNNTACMPAAWPQGHPPCSSASRVQPWYAARGLDSCSGAPRRHSQHSLLKNSQIGLRLAPEQVVDVSRPMQGKKAAWEPNSAPAKPSRPRSMARDARASGSAQRLFHPNFARLP
jgi:hypothetical protein